MSLRSQPLIPPVPGDTSRTAHAAFRRGNPYLLLRDQLGALFSDADFADLYPMSRDNQARQCASVIGINSSGGWGFDTSTLTDEPGGHPDAAAGGGASPTPGDTVNYTGKLHHERGR